MGGRGQGGQRSIVARNNRPARTLRDPGTGLEYAQRCLDIVSFEKRNEAILAYPGDTHVVLFRRDNALVLQHVDVSTVGVGFGAESSSGTSMATSNSNRFRLRVDAGAFGSIGSPRHRAIYMRPTAISSRAGDHYSTRSVRKPQRGRTRLAVEGAVQALRISGAAGAFRLEQRTRQSSS